MISLNQVRLALRQHSPLLISESTRKPAAVGLLLTHGATGLEMMFIERSAHPNDPWSGNLAFPGGRVAPEDVSTQATAERENREEIGLDLSCAEFLGQLDDIGGAYLPVTISCFVYFLQEPPALLLNHEVTRSFWFPLKELANPDRLTQTKLFWQGKERQIHAIIIDDKSPLLWGITFRLVVQFLSLVNGINPSLLTVIDD